MSDNPATPATPSIPSIPQPLPYRLEPDDKVTPMMVYTNTSMARGEFVSKEVVRVGTWLRTVSGIAYISLYRAQSMTSTGGPTSRINQADDSSRSR